MKDILQNILKGKIVIVGIGNTLRGDDGFGPALIERLQGKIEACCLDAGSAPENFTGKIIREQPDTILIVDALHLERLPGEYELLKKEEIVKSGLSTHDVSPNMLIEYLEDQTSADIYVLGVQPEDVSLGEGMSGSVKKAIEEIAGMISEQLRLAQSSQLTARRNTHDL